MFTRISTTMILASILVASTSLAGAIPGTGPVSFTGGETYQCAAVNIGKKALSDVVVSVTKGNTSAPEVSSSSCATTEPNAVCGIQSSAVGAGLRFCTVTLKGSAKALRGKFCNLATGECSELR